MSSVKLTVGVKVFSGWQSVKIERGIEQIAGTFELTVTDRWNTATGLESVELKPGEPCQVFVNDNRLITGYIDTVHRSYDKGAHQISLSGRDKAGDLVDCSAIYKTGQWKNVGIDKIAKDLVSPFGIPVIVSADIGQPLPVFAIQEGASVFEELERAAKMRALLLMSDGLGNLVLTRAGHERAPADLVQGDNILQAEGTFDWKDRFSQYIVKGQRPGDDTDHGSVVSHQSASITDSVINRYRPFVVMAEDQDGNASLKQRAEWERNVRAGRGSTATITVQGWQVNGKLWSPNTLVHLRSPLLSADFDFLIVSVSFSLDESGELTALQLSMPSAFATIQGVKQTRLEKKIRKAQGDEASIVDTDYQMP